MSPIRTGTSIAAAAIAAAIYVPALAAGRTFGYDDMFRVVGMSTPRMSPDGTRVVIVVSRTDREHDKTLRELDLVDIANGARRTLTFERKGLSEPRWSPSGDRIAFVADATTNGKERSQVWVMPVSGGDARRVTSATEGVEQFAWRPDGNAIAYVAVDPEPRKTGDARYIDAYRVGNDPALANGAKRAARVWLQTLDGGKPRLLTPGDGTATTGEAESTLSFSPDGATLAYLHAPTPVLNDADDATSRLIDVGAAHERPLGASTSHERDPLFSPDGTRVAYLHSGGDAQTHPTQAYVTAATGGAGRSVSQIVDRAVRDIGWEPDGKALDFTVTDGTQFVLYRALLDGTAARRVDLGDVSITSGLDGALAKDGGIAFIGSTTQHPDELYYAAQGSAPKQLTHDNDAIAALSLGTSERITYPTSTGVSGDAVLLKPPGFTPDRSYPLVVAIHGGPTMASTQTFSMRAQLLAAHGWLVLMPNYRGSDNLGERYQRAIFMDTVEGPGRDIRAALDAVRARGIVDPARVAVSGWSYGGVMTTWMITRYHDWRVAVAGAPVTDQIADYATADDINADRELFRGSPWVGNNRADYVAQSSITYVRNVTTPVLLMTDRGDQRVSPVSAYEFYHALRDLGKPVELVVYPVDGHFPGDPVRAADVNRRWVAYIAEHFVR